MALKGIQSNSYTSTSNKVKLSTCPLCGKTRIDEGYVVGDWDLCHGHRYEDVAKHVKQHKAR